MLTTSRPWSIFFFWLNIGFTVWWTLDLVNTLVLVIHGKPFSWGSLLLQVFFSVLSVFFATQYKEQVWPKE